MFTQSSCKSVANHSNVTLAFLSSLRDNYMIYTLQKACITQARLTIYPKLIDELFLIS